MLVARGRGIAQTHVLGVVSVLILARVATALLAIHENCKLDQLMVYKPVELPAGFRLPDHGKTGLGGCTPWAHLLFPGVDFIECEERETFYPYVLPDSASRRLDKKIAVEPGRYRISLNREISECVEIINKEHKGKYTVKEYYDKLHELEKKSCIIFEAVSSLKAQYEIRYDYLPRDGNYRYFYGNKFEIYGDAALFDISTAEKVVRLGRSALSKSYMTFWWLEGLDPVSNPLWSGNFLSVCEDVDLPL